MNYPTARVPNTSKRVIPAKKEYQQELSDVEHAAWSLIFGMIEVGADPETPRRRHKGKNKLNLGWWEAEWNRLKAVLERRGLNCNPEDE
jgi:hypothetical protein